MRVTFICLEWPHEGHVGGVGRYAYRLASALATRPDIDLTIVTFAGGTPLDGASLRTIPRPSGRLGRFYGSPLRLRRVISATRPDVIHSFGDDWALASHRGTPLVRTFLGSSLAEARSSTGLRKLNHYVLAVTERISSLRADVKIGIGPDSVEEFECEDFMPPVTAVQAPEDVHKTDEASVVFVGSYSGRKRGAVVADAVEAIRARTGLQIVLTVVGPSSDAHSWPAGTRHVSGASDADVLRIISRSWVLVAPSLYEGFGIPTYEALSMGTPVIASSNPGSEYMRSLTEPAGILQICPDVDLSDALAARLSGGPSIEGPEDSGRRTAVERLTTLASPRRLIEEIYPRALRLAKNGGSRVA
jgi:glycosyltransferase involved in cell wall biosynthesis